MRTSLKSFVAAVLAAPLALATAMPASAAMITGSSSYLSFADSPFSIVSFSSSPFPFVFEDFEDGAFSMPGVTLAGGIIGNFGSGTDSVENGSRGRSYFASGGRISIVFNLLTLGALPTHVGLAWTDGTNGGIFEAFDQNGTSLGTLSVTSATPGFGGQRDEDRFFGAINARGISRFTFSGSSVEIDHLQFGIEAIKGGVPEPATWAMMLGGFGLVGGAMRGRRLKTALS